MDDCYFEPFDTMARQNLELIRDIAGPDFSGDTRLDPTLNGALAHIHRADEVIVLFRQGAFPLARAERFVSTTRQLLALCRKRYGVAAVKPMEQAFFTHFALWHYEGSPLHPPELFAKKLFAAEEQLLAAICTANVQIATLEAAQPPPKARRGRGRPAKSPDKAPVPRGPKNTRMMKVERKEVECYLEIDCHRTVDSCTPEDCLHVWNLPGNKASFDRAARQNDLTRGYSDYLALYHAVIYYNERKILQSQRKKAGIRAK